MSALRLPITTEDQAWLDSNFQWLLQEFGTDRFLAMPMRLYHPDFFPEHFSFQDGNQSFIYYVDKVCGWMEVEPERITPVLVKAGELEVPALGAYQRYMNYQDQRQKYRIHISQDLLKQVPQLIAILAHEISHVKLMGEGRVAADEEDHEFLTDLCAVYWGFGALSANDAFSSRARYVPGSGEMHWSLSASGYLPLEMWAYALALFAYLQQDTRPAWARFLSREVYPLFQRCHRYLFTTHDCGVDLQAAVPVAAVPANDLAMRHCEVLISQYPDKPEGYLKRAERYLTKNQLEAAFRDLNRALTLQPGLVPALLVRARIKTDLGDWPEAMEDLNQALSMQPDAVNCLALRGHLFILQDRLPEALADFGKALALQPTQVEVWLNRAYVWEQQKEWLKALADYEQAVKLAPKNWRALMERGWLRARLGDLPAALSDLNEAIALEPAQVWPCFYRGIVLRKLGQHQAALRDFDRALQLEAGWQEIAFERHFTLQCFKGRLEGEWVDLCYYDIPDEVYELRKQLRTARIRHKVRVHNPSFTANTHKGCTLVIPASDAEAAWDMLHRWLGNTDMVI
ncbi:MAG: tetratricopeptide repeat protein [Bacteroidetes bacterium]|nr:MAG: tetratricopeptide repeat protein [Bacteroidota bacterium]